MKLGLPLKNLNLLRYPAGNVFQYYAENCSLYTEAFKRMNSPSLCHNGIDCVTYENDEVVAVADGLVVKADFGETTHGNGVWLATPYVESGIRKMVLTCYFHMNKLNVQTGQWVKKEDILGWEGNTGFIVTGSTPYWGNAPAGKGVHVHFGVYPYFESQEVGLVVNGVNYAKCFPDNNENGAVDSIPWLTDDVSAKQITLIELMKKYIELLKAALLKKP